VTYPSQDRGYGRVGATIQSASLRAEKPHSRMILKYLIGCVGTVVGMLCSRTHQSLGTTCHR
jgi:hypothetical protein